MHRYAYEITTSMFRIEVHIIGRIVPNGYSFFFFPFSPPTVGRLASSDKIPNAKLFSSRIINPLLSKRTL